MKMKGVSTATAAVLIIIAIGAFVVFAGPRLGINLLSAAGGEAPAVTVQTACDDDKLVRLLAAYNDFLADDAASVAVDSFLYQINPDGTKTLVLNQADETSATFGTYNEVGTNVLECGKSYEFWLGDETEEYFRGPFSFVASGSEKRITVTDGIIIGGETWDGFDSGTLESTPNLTLGSGATSNALEIRYTSSTANQGHEAPDGMILAFAYNDTAWLTVEPRGVSVSGNVKTNGQAIRALQGGCPDVVGRTLFTSETDKIYKCYLTPVTSVLDGGEVKFSMYLALESGVNPDVTGTPRGDLTAGAAIQAVMLDQNHFQNTENPPSFPMELGYQDDDEANVGEPTTTRLTIVFA